MLNLLADLRGASRFDILCVGAHCDDIEIGCGGTLLELQRRYRCRIHWGILSSTPTRRLEAEKAMRAFVSAEARGEFRVGALPDAHLPDHLSKAKEFLQALRKDVDPHLIFTTGEADRHQDHRLTNEVTWQTFRNHMICEYEIPKYDGDLTTPNMYVPIGPKIAQQKSRKLMQLYASQRDKHWFTSTTFESLLRLRGIECRSQSGLAEAFHCRKWIFGGSEHKMSRRSRA